MNSDRLYQLMMKRLERADLNNEAEEDLLLNVTAEYMAELMAQGNIPHFLLNVVERDIGEELLEMYRKKTYGHMNPSSYRGKKPRQRKPADSEE